MTLEHEKINYLEFPARDIKATKAFFAATFDWSFVDCGPDYCAFSNAGIDGGFFSADLSVSAKAGSVLIVIYSQSLAETQKKITDAGGTIVIPPFSFPGGHRFHFSDPSGNEFAVWSEILG